MPDRERLLQDVVRAIESRTGKGMKVRGAWRDGRCPAHEDKRNSLSIRAGDARIIVKCRTGCSEDQVAAALGYKLADLFYEKRPGRGSRGRPRRRRTGGVTLEDLAAAKGIDVERLRSWGCEEEKPTRGKPRIRIAYREMDGAAARTRIRFGPSGNRGSAWARGGEEDLPIVPYGLWLLPDWPDEETTLTIVEGESDSWALWQAGIPALGIPGAQMCGCLLPHHLTGWERLVIVQEPDAGGVGFVEALSKRLADMAWDGEAVVISCAPAKDPSDLYLRGRDRFAREFRSRMESGTALSQAVAQAPLEYNEANVADEFLRTAPRPTQFCEAATGGAVTRILLYRDLFYEWDGRAYRELPRSELEARIATYIRSRDWIDRKGNVSPAVPKAASVRNVIVNVAAQGCVPASARMPVWLDGRPGDRCLVVQNGILDLDEAVPAILAGRPADYEPRPHTADLFTLHELPYGYVAEARCPRWQTFLDEMLPDRALQSVLQQWFGYCLVPTQRYQRILLMVGQGNNGKSVISAVLRRLVGTENTAAVDCEYLGEPHALEPLQGKLVNFASEWSYLKPAGAAVLKKISGGDPATINPKGSRAFMELLPTRFVISANDPPTVPDRSDAFWRRLLCLPFDVQVPEERKRPFEAFVDELCEELAGVFYWALCGLIALDRQGGFVEPPAMMEYKHTHREDSNPAAVWCELYLTVDPDGSAAVNDLYTAYSEYCRASGFRPLNKAHFGRELNRWYRRITGNNLEKRRPRRGEGREHEYIGVAQTPRFPLIEERMGPNTGSLQWS